jgi:3-oxoacyl-[acyl-carrier-protein] synthase-3
MESNMNQTQKTFAKVVGTGRYLPNAPIGNAELVARMAAKGVETSDEWIRERSGITQRYWANDDQPVSVLAEFAARQALEAAGMGADELDFIIIGSSTPDMIFPSAACLLQSKLGAKNAAALDVQAACTGFVYAMTVANAMIQSGQIKTALVVGAETISDILDEEDRTTAVLFGDGAGAAVLKASDEPGILACNIHSDGDLSSILYGDARIRGGQLKGDPRIKMDGQAVFKNAVSFLSEDAQATLDKAGMTVEQLDWYIPHQANIRIIQSAGKRLGIPMEKTVVTVDQHGNTSAASVPLALDTAVRDGRIQKGQTVLMQGVGGGFTWGTVLMRF